MFNYLKKHNMRNSLKTLLCLTAICVFSNNAAARICFLPDGDCGKTKINVNSGKNGCIYKSETEANTGKSECEVSYQSQVNSCWWRRCNSDNKTIFDKLADCQKKIEDATSQKCQACGSCYKLVTIPIPQNACPDGYSTKYQSPSDCDDNESFSENGTYNGLVCGACTKTETCPSGYSTQYQSQKDCQSGETFSSNGSVGNLTCGKCEKKNPTCNEINSSYYSVSNTAKYDECDQDSDIYDMYDVNVTGSDGKCFYCHHRTCDEIADYVDAGEQWYTSCKANETAEKVPYLPGADGQCYTCKKTYDMLCSQINSSYIGAKSSCEDEEYSKNIVYDVIGLDGQCYTCKNYKGYIVFDYLLEGNSEAGYQYGCGTRTNTQLYYCNRNNFGEEYEVGDYTSGDPKDIWYYQSICQAVSDWYAYLNIGSEKSEFNYQNWTLPFDMEMVVTYDIPSYDANCTMGWNRLGDIQTYPEIFKPRTVHIKFPKGSKIGASIRKQPVDFLDGISQNHMTIEYYVNGKKISGNLSGSSSITIGGVVYSFSGTY